MNRFTRFSSWAVLAGTLTVGASAASAQQQLIEASKNPGQWVMPGRTYDLQRHSPLKQITTANVKDLQVAWTFSTGVLRGHEGNPLVIGHVMYVHSAFPNKVFALDLSKPGAPQIWQFTPEQPADVIPIACCDVVNRGLAYSPKYDRLFIELLSGDLLALDAKTGKQVYRVKSADYKKGETMTNAPLVVGDVVVTGISGGEFGVRGRLNRPDLPDTGRAHPERVLHRAGHRVKPTGRLELPTPSLRVMCSTS